MKQAFDISRSVVLRIVFTRMVLPKPSTAEPAECAEKYQDLCDLNGLLEQDGFTSLFAAKGRAAR